MISKRTAAFIIILLIIIGTFVGPAVWETYLAAEPKAEPTRSSLSAVVLAPTQPPIEPSSTPTHEPTQPPTETAIPTDTLSPTVGPSPTASNTPTFTPAPTDTPIPTETPTTLPQLVPTLGITTTPRFAEGVPTPATAIPSPVPTFEVPRDVTNVLLLGSDTTLDTGDTRTDTMIIVSISHGRKTASMISIPRDVYVYIPGWTMNRINTALARGSATGYPGGGIGLLEQTILYNFGIPIHYYARIDFEGFQEVVDAIGGVEIGVSCQLTDWRLKSPDLNPQVEDNWERFTLEPGIYDMDGDLALWYARSRLTTNDFDRGRRQQQLLRGMLDTAVDLNLVTQVPALWDAFQSTVETDMDIGRILQLAALAPAIRENGVQNLYLAGKTQSWTVPHNGANVQLPLWEGNGMMKETFTRLFLPPALNRATQPPIFVEIVNATGNPDMAALAADNLAWHGFVPVMGADSEAQPTTTLTRYGPNLKGAYGWLLSWIFARVEDDIVINGEDTFAYDYQVVLGEDYNPCRPQMSAPQIFIDNQ
ncbi:MAG: LCP family protein [Ardenticatenaceae bacterium]|nr:LCP family protein [Ardenticatenaceae bacterium]